MTPSRVAAIVVLFHPDQAVLARLLGSLAPQVEKIFILDNTPGAGEADGSRYQLDVPVGYHPMGGNMGIAAAQNRGIEFAAAEQFSHVLLMDQDSQPQPAMVTNLLNAEAELLRGGERLAAVGPVFVDAKTHQALPAVRHFFLVVRKVHVEPGATHPVEADYLISSGCLIRLSMLERIGGMREDLFIDWVDIEWGLRARAQGCQSYMIPSAVMNHNLGDATTQVLSRHIYLHSDIRNYYIVRNATYLLRVGTMGWRWRSVTLLKIPQYVVFYSFHSKRPLFSLKLLCRAFIDGVQARMGAIR
jgi:rhamnosyltransferase